MSLPRATASPDAVEPEGRGGTSVFAVLRRRALIVVLTTLLVGAAAAAFAYASRDRYESTAKLLFRQTVGPELTAVGIQPTAPDVDKLTQDNVALVDARPVAIIVAGRLTAAGNPTSVSSVEKDTVVAGTKNDDVVSIVARGDSPQNAAQLAQEYAKASVELIESRQAGRALAARRVLGRQLAALSATDRKSGVGSRLTSRMQQLETLAAIGTGSPRIIQPGTVPTAKAGSIPRTIVIGLLLGVVLGVGLALLREQADRRLSRPDEVSAAFDAPVLTTVPRQRAVKKKVPYRDLPPPVAEAFRMLQMNLRYGHGEPVHSLIVTSSRSGEGKSTVVWNLACAAAAAGLSVAVVEADLRRPTLAERGDLQPQPGLTEVLDGELTISAAMQVASPDATQSGREGILEVLVAGRRVEDPSALMQSVRMGEVLTSLKRHYDLVLVDTPPLPHVADAISLLGRVDGVLVVASVNSTKGPAARALRDQLQSLDARVLGVVANGGSASAGYAYVSSPTRA